MIRAIILDLNGLLITSEKLSDRFARKYHVPAKLFLDGLNDVMPTVRRPGAKPAYFYWKPWFRQWNVQITSKEFFHFWFSGEKLDRKVLQLLRKVRTAHPEIKIFALSNNFRERSRHYRKKFPELFHVVDHVYYSWQTGHVKPSKDSLRHILRDTMLRSANCLYIDDRQSNSDVAKTLGFRAYCYHSPADLRRMLHTNNLA